MPLGNTAGIGFGTLLVNDIMITVHGQKNVRPLALGMQWTSHSLRIGYNMVYS